jgi:hypothetical protein
MNFQEENKLENLLINTKKKISMKNKIISNLSLIQSLISSKAQKKTHQSVKKSYKNLKIPNIWNPGEHYKMKKNQQKCKIS